MLNKENKDEHNNINELFHPIHQFHLSIDPSIHSLINQLIHPSYPFICTPIHSSSFINAFKYHVSCTDGKISVRIIYFYYLFFHRRPTHKLCFLSCKPFVVNVTFSTGLVVPSSQNKKEKKKTEETSRPVENVTLATKGLQERKQLVSGTTVEK